MIAAFRNSGIWLYVTASTSDKSHSDSSENYSSESIHSRDINDGYSSDRSDISNSYSRESIDSIDVSNSYSIDSSDSDSSDSIDNSDLMRDYCCKQRPDPSSSPQPGIWKQSVANLHNLQPRQLYKTLQTCGEWQLDVWNSSFGSY